MDFSRIKTYSLSDRLSKVSTGVFGVPHKAGGSLAEFLANLPGVLGAKDLHEIVTRIHEARTKDKPVILGMGAHPIKVGLNPVLIDLIDRKIITAMAMNGACLVHDFEVALAGTTSEDVDSAILDGSFGMARETGLTLNRAISEGVRDGLGLGAAVGRMIHRDRLQGMKTSLFGTCFEARIPVTVHVAIGTDILHMHPEADGAAIGEGSLRDFRLLVELVSKMEGGVYINLGSAVVLPEVFLKAVTLARNLGYSVGNMTTVNMDFIQHYRPSVNVLKRPTLANGKAFALTGHHELMVPLLAAALVEKFA